MKAATLLLLCLLSSVALAMEPGERLAPWTLLDQFDAPYTLNDETHILLVARDMGGAKLVNAALEGQPKSYLEQRQAVFLADISRMPSVIATLFALPKMRDYNYRILLDRNARIAPRYPASEGEVLWLQLGDGQLLEQKVFKDAAALKLALDSVQAP
ncbi:FAD/FMN-containing dehydrogenase [Ectopseudomonas khazarica]|uniref:FAD/FMN-containing dehydrogenase n=1 Tax=Ectopseudomonas khazarica TaxID=2502979 RepID=UPI003A8E2A11